MDFGRIPELWMNAITKPAETFKSEKRNAKLLDGVIHYSIAGFIVGLIATVMFILSVLFLQIYLPYDAWSIMLIPIFYPIIYPIFLIVITLILAGIFFIMAKILGGKGNFETQYYLLAIFHAPIIIIISSLSLIPIIGYFISLVIHIYALYLLTLSIREAHELDTAKAVLTWLIPGLIIIILLIIFMSLIRYIILT
jgi:hypothetical protein